MTFTPLFLLFLSGLLVDAYLWRPARFLMRNWNPVFKWTGWTLFSANVILLSVFLFLRMVGPVSRSEQSWVLVVLFTGIMTRIMALIFVLLDDFRRTALWITKLFTSPVPVAEPGEQRISRSEFLTKTAVFAAALPATAMSYGILSGAHDYQIHRIKLKLSGLPKKFHGLRMVQISDIHAGSFTNKTAVQGGIELLTAEKPDLIVFTGDLVNTRAGELKDWRNDFERIKAPLGVFSVRGNHDYSDYGTWPDKGAQARNAQHIAEAHGVFGWKLLRNESARITVEGEQIGILGCENWGLGRFAKYGNLEKTMQNTDDLSVKILLSHDPSHWDAQVRPFFPEISLQLSGHTHGAQFGVEWGDFRWSPAQYLYKQWAGLYEQQGQLLYVNRGLGYIGIPGRIGIPPEITVFELESA